jgi:hypothetical protein
MKKKQSPNSLLKKINQRLLKKPDQTELNQVLHPILSGIQKANQHVDQAGDKNRFIRLTSTFQNSQWYREKFVCRKIYTQRPVKILNYNNYRRQINPFLYTSSVS